jgi:hypothetical protein
MVPLDLSRSTTYEDPSIVEPADREREFLQADHLRLYGADFPDRLREASFIVTVDPWVRELDPRCRSATGCSRRRTSTCALSRAF